MKQKPRIPATTDVIIRQRIAQFHKSQLFLTHERYNKQQESIEGHEMMASRCRKHTGRSKTAGSFLYRLFGVMGVIRTQRTRTHICKIVCRTTFCILTSCTDCQSNQRKENTFWLKATFMGERGKKRNNKPFFCLLSHLH